MPTVAFLGTGLLGSAMAERMLRHGDQVTVWNRTAEKARRLGPLGARVAASPGDAVAGADIVHMALPDDAIVDAMLDTIRPHAAPGATVIDHSTTAPAGTARRVPRANAGGMRFLHAPVFMSPQSCRDGVGFMLVSGPQAVYESVRERLARMTGEVIYYGERPDLAAAFKIFGNSMIFAITAGVADILAMARNLDVAPNDAVGLFSKFQVGNILAARGQKMASGDLTATFELTMARKDIGLMIDAAGANPLAALPSIARRMDDAIAAGHGAHDLGAIAEPLRR